MNDFNMHISPGRKPLALLAEANEELFPARKIALPTVLVHSNADLCDQPSVTFETLCGPYRAREAMLEPVLLHRMPSGTTVLGGNSFLVRTGDCLVQEQISPLTENLPSLLESIALHARKTETISEPCVLVARFGEATWGHWLAEILPAAIVAEHVHPGRFRYVVPGYTTRPGKIRDFATAVMESLAAYGIGEDRLLRLDDARNYRFTDLRIVGGLWSSAVLNPAVVELMRTTIVSPVPKPAKGSRRIALLRAQGSNRSLFNHADVVTFLEKKTFMPVDLNALTFLEQVAMFRHAEDICGMLGSGLTGLIYARDGVRVLSIAPADWFDFYFYMMVQLRGGTYVDFRGPVVWNGTGLRRDAPIVVDPAQLEQGFAALSAATDAAPDSRVICGIELPRLPGGNFFSLDFSETGNAAAYRDYGWSVQEERSIWSVGPISRLAIPMADIKAPKDRDSWFLELHVNTFVAPPCLVARMLTVVVNGHELARFEIGGALVTVGCRIPRQCLDGHDTLDILFGHVVCPPANVLGVGDDARPLGIGFLALHLRDLAVPTPLPSFNNPPGEKP